MKKKFGKDGVKPAAIKEEKKAGEAKALASIPEEEKGADAAGEGKNAERNRKKREKAKAKKAAQKSQPSNAAKPTGPNVVGKIEGRGGAAFETMGSTQTEDVFLLAGGASRQAQFDDFYWVGVSKTDDSVTAVSLKTTELDGFKARHSIGTAYHDGKVLMFAGQNAEQMTSYNDVFLYHAAKNEVEKVEYLSNGAIVPKPRNSHGMVQKDDIAYIYGGANEEGPLNDAYTLDLKSNQFKKLKIKNADKAPNFEMHSAHVWENKLILIGGRNTDTPEKQDGNDAMGAAMMALFRDVILAVDLDTGEIDEFAKLPTGIASHTGAIIGDYLFLYGGTNGLKFFDAVTRYDIKNKKWTLLTKYPTT